jgi:predicted metal-binding protein
MWKQIAGILTSMKQDEEEHAPLNGECIRSIGFTAFAEFKASLLIPEQKIRDLCVANKCGNYSNNYMCPPHSGTPEQIKARISTFKHGVLLQYSRPLDVEHDEVGLKITKRDFHEKLLQLENCLREKGPEHIWGMTAGFCGLCEPCYAVSGEPCPLPDKARTSLVALGIDVISLLDRLGMDSGFHPDRITWTGCVLY